MIVADPLRPGGILSGLRPGTYVPIADYTTRSVPDWQYDIVVLKQEYDGASYAGIPDTGGVTTFSKLGGKTTIYLLPTENLPLTQPLRDLGVPPRAVDALDSVLRPLIDAGYARNDPKPSGRGAVPTRPRPKAGDGTTKPNTGAAAAAHHRGNSRG